MERMGGWMDAGTGGWAILHGMLLRSRQARLGLRPEERLRCPLKKRREGEGVGKSLPRLLHHFSLRLGRFLLAQPGIAGVIRKDGEGGGALFFCLFRGTGPPCLQGSFTAVSQLSTCSPLLWAAASLCVRGWRGGNK